MANPNGKKGAWFERETADYWRDNWDDRIDRRVKTGAKDKGDIANVRLGDHRIVVECKNVGTSQRDKDGNLRREQKYNLATWIREAQEEAENDGALCGIVIAKRIGKGQPEDQYVIMTQGDLVKLLHAVSHP
jgi:hypothetical protein